MRPVPGNHAVDFHWPDHRTESSQASDARKSQPHFQVSDKMSELRH